MSKKLIFINKYLYNYKKKSKERMRFLFPSVSTTVEDITTEHILYQDEYFYIKIYSNRSDNILKFKNWKRNRAPDIQRIEEIKNYYILNDRHLVDGMISVWNNNDEYFIYDGLHRFEACKLIENEMWFIVCHFETNKESDIIQHFQNINKSVNVPYIYLENNPNELKKMISENVAKELCFQYPSFVSSSRKPFTYNFNRDNLIEFISELTIDFQINDCDKKILSCLNELNLISKQKYVNKLCTPKKCHTHNFYLFLLESSEIKKYIENKLQN
jgi:uncharacterized protein (DUF1015 family)